MTNKYVVGQVFEDNWDDEVGRIVYANGEWVSDEDRAAFEDSYGGMPDDMPEVILYEFMYHDEFVEGVDAIQDFVRENGLIDVAERERKDQERQVIVDTLNAMGVNTSDLIVSEGRVYMGTDECEAYIQGSHAWCSSSMLC